MVVAFATAYYALDGEITRRKLAFTEADRALETEGKRRKLMKLDPYTIVAVVAFAGILGAKSGTLSIHLPTASTPTLSKVLARC